MTVYEELSAINDLLAVDQEQSTSFDIKAINNLVYEQQNNFNRACANFNDKLGISNFTYAHSTFLCLPDQQLGNTTVNIVRTTLDQKGFDWRVLDAYGNSISEASDLKKLLGAEAAGLKKASELKARLLECCNFDLSHSWLFFNITGAYLSSIKNTSYSEETICLELLSSMPSFDGTSAKIIKMNKSNVLSKAVVHSATQFSIGVPFGQAAGYNIPKTFCDACWPVTRNTNDTVSETNTAASAVSSFSSRFERAKEFIEHFAAMSKNGFYKPSEIRTEEDIKKCAFHVVDLVNVYTHGDLHIKNCMKDLLDILGSKIGHNNPKNRTYIKNHKSVQYLYNACQQEATIIKEADGFIPLYRNQDATGLDGNSWYLFAQGDRHITDKADFIYKYTTEDSINVEVKVDAKIYFDTNSEDQFSDKAAHDAVFLIEYLIAPNKWVLKPVKENASILDEVVYADVQKRLFAFVNRLNTNQSSFTRINSQLVEY
jgi:hypothetical protein